MRANTFEPTVDLRTPAKRPPKYSVSPQRPDEPPHVTRRTGHTHRGNARFPRGLTNVLKDNVHHASAGNFAHLILKVGGDAVIYCCVGAPAFCHRQFVIELDVAITRAPKCFATWTLPLPTPEPTASTSTHSPFCTWRESSDICHAVPNTAGIRPTLHKSDIIRQANCRACRTSTSIQSRRPLAPQQFCD